MCDDDVLQLVNNEVICGGKVTGGRVSLTQTPVFIYCRFRLVCKMKVGIAALIGCCNPSPPVDTDIVARRRE